MLRLIRGLFRRRVPIRALSDAAEMRLKNQRFLGKRQESERWEGRMRKLVASLQSRAGALEKGEIGASDRAGGLRQAAVDLEEAIEDLTTKREG